MATGAIGQLAIIQQLSDPAAMRSKITGYEPETVVLTGTVQRALAYPRRRASDPLDNPRDQDQNG